jgi:hypothetical protein
MSPAHGNIARRDKDALEEALEDAVQEGVEDAIEYISMGEGEVEETGAGEEPDDDVHGPPANQHAKVGLYALTPPDPQLKGAWFQPLQLASEDTGC